MADVVRSPAGAGRGRYSTVAILLHWLIAAAILFQIMLPARMEGPPTPQTFAITQLHKSVGITILLLSLVRLAWRLTNPPPPLPLAMARWERVLSRITHWGFYGIMIGMPLTGWLMVSASKLAVPTLLYGALPWPDIPGLAQLAPASKFIWHEAAKTSHDLLAKVLYGLLGLHVAGALKHQLFDRDEPVLGRIFPGAVAGRRLEPRILIIALGALAAVAFGKLISPPVPGMAPTAAAAPESPPEPVTAQAPAPPLAAATAPASAPEAAPPAAPAHWVVSRGSTLGFSTSWSGAPLQGRFDRWTADILFSPDDLAASRVKVSIDVGSVNTGDAQRDASLPSADWFDAASHPKATFTASRFEQTAAGRYVAHGTLELRGVKQPQDLAFRLTITGDQARMSGTASLDRTAFGVGQGEWAATDQIPAKVAVRVELQARRDQR